MYIYIIYIAIIIISFIISNVNMVGLINFYQKHRI